MDWTIVVSAVMAILAGTFGVFWGKGKSKFSKAVTLGREAVDVIETLEAALVDNVIDKAEVDQIKKELADVKAAWKALIAKEAA